MPTTESTLYRSDGGAAWITLNRPDNRNALSQSLVTELDAHLAAANDDTNVRCIVITGAGPAFCAGADLKNQNRQGEPEVSVWSAPATSSLRRRMRSSASRRCGSA
jgi:enoyl-CoA hydratase/carnithine racemase